MPTTAGQFLTFVLGSGINQPPKTQGTESNSDSGPLGLQPPRSKFENQISTIHNLSTSLFTLTMPSDPRSRRVAARNNRRSYAPVPPRQLPPTITSETSTTPPSGRRTRRHAVTTLSPPTITPEGTDAAPSSSTSQLDCTTQANPLPNSRPTEPNDQCLREIRELRELLHRQGESFARASTEHVTCLLYTSDAADE